jgi:ABC-2 type transport system ATP-binding protein
MEVSAIEISGLRFSYPERPVFDGLSLRVEEGLRFGLFGPNGAGKTTLMNLMTGLLTFREGSIRLFGRPAGRGTRSLFGFVPQDFSFYMELSPWQNLEFYGAWYGLSLRETHRRAFPLLEVLGLADVRHQPARQFSGGMKRRLNLAIGVIHEPRLLFLDEPTVGVDVQTAYAIMHYLETLNTRGTTLVYTSHQLDEAERLCQSIALIDQGAILAEGQVHTLLSEHRQEDLRGLYLELTGKAYRDV